MISVIWNMCNATAKNDILKSRHKNTLIFWTLLKFSTNSVCISFKIKLVLSLARHAVAQHNKLIQQLFLFFSLKYPNVVFQNNGAWPPSQQPWLFTSVKGKQFFCHFLLSNLARIMCLFIRTLKFRDFMEQGGSQDSIVSIMTHCRLDGTGIKSRWGHDFPQPSRMALGPTWASSTMGTRSFPGVKWPEHCIDHPPSPTAKV
jgi:hypothetical protein